MYAKNFDKWFEYFRENKVKEDFTKNIFPGLFSEELNYLSIKVCNIIEYLADKIFKLEDENVALKSAIKVLIKSNKFYGDSAKWQELHTDLKTPYKEGEGIWYLDNETDFVLCDGGKIARQAEQTSEVKKAVEFLK